jgi:hypothetical protein
MLRKRQLEVRVMFRPQASRIGGAGHTVTTNLEPQTIL